MRAGVGAAVLLASSAATWVAHADPIRILVAVQPRAGALPASFHCSTPPRTLSRCGAFSRHSGDFRPADVITLADPTLAALNAALDRAGTLAASHTTNEVTFVFYFSGHGDRDRLHLGTEVLAMADPDRACAEPSPQHSGCS